MPTGKLDEQQRASVRPMLNERSPADALAAYYALHHPAERTEIFVHADGFLVRARTGMDLFRPLVTLRARTEAAAQALFQTGLPANRPVYLALPENLAVWANKYLSVTEAELCRIYRFPAERYEPIINVLLTTSTGPDGAPRCEIRAGDRPGAVAGLNWQSPRFAEIYVHAEPAIRGRGWGKSVVSALVGLLLKAGRIPLYVVSESNDYSLRLAEAVGFEDTGEREYVGQGIFVG